MGKKNIGVKALCYSIRGEYKVLGDSSRCVSVFSPIDKAGKESVAFCSKSTEEGLQRIRNSGAGVIISPKELSYREDDYDDRTLILVPNPRLAFLRVLQKFSQKKIDFGISPSAVVDKDTKVIIGRNVVTQASTVIGAEGFGHEWNGKGEWEKFPQIGGVIIEDDVEIGSNTSIMRGAIGDTIIGRGK